MKNNQIPKIIKSKIYKDKRGSLKEIFKSFTFTIGSLDTFDTCSCFFSLLGFRIFNVGMWIWAFGFEEFGLWILEFGT